LRNRNFNGHRRAPFMAIGIHRPRPRRSFGGKNFAGTDRELYASKGTSCLGRQGARHGSSTHAHEDETINIREEPGLRSTGVATHPTLTRSAFLYAAIHFRAPLTKNETQGPTLPPAVL